MSAGPRIIRGLLVAAAIIALVVICSARYRNVEKAERDNPQPAPAPTGGPHPTTHPGERVCIDPASGEYIYTDDDGAAVIAGCDGP